MSDTWAGSAVPPGKGGTEQACGTEPPKEGGRAAAVKGPNAGGRADAGGRAGPGKWAKGGKPSKGCVRDGHGKEAKATGRPMPGSGSKAASKSMEARGP